MVDYHTSGGAEFYKADLHVHTPGSYDYEDDIGPDELIDAFEDEGLDIVAVTDHNTTGYYEELAEAAEDSSVTILPGVEITTGQSGEHQIHLTAIFDPEKADIIDGLLYEIGIRDDPEDAISDATIPKICQKVRSEDGLPILAHIDEKAGADYELADRNNPTREEVFDEENVAALEVVSPDTAEEFPAFACIRSSDAHSVSDLGRGYTYLKMSEPSFEGLRTALSDPESRVSLDAEPTTHSSVDGLFVSEGFLQPRRVQFNGNLNCLIGGKGTGKSSVIEHIRYALDIDPRSEDIREEYESLLQDNLGPDGRAEVIVTGNNGDQYRIRREFEEDPQIERVSEDGSGDPEPVNVPIERFREEIFDAEIHSQRELIQLARDEIDQLDLLDSYFDIEDEVSERESVKSDLRDKSREIQSLREEVDDLTAKEERFRILKKQVEVMEEKGVKEYIEGQEDWERERTKLSQLVDDVDEALSEAQELDISGTIDTIEAEDGPNKELLGTASEESEQLKEDVSQHEQEIVKRIEEAKDEIDSIWELWREENEEREEEHSELADEIEAEIDVDIEEFFSKQAELEKLRGVSEDLEETEDELENALEEKEQLFEELEAARRELTQARREGIEELNGELNEVRVSLKGRSNRTEYTEWINHVLEGSNVHTVDKETIAETFDPRELVEIVRDRDTDRLADEAEVTSTAAENFVTHDDLNEQLTKLELFEIHDRPVIELNDSGWKKLSEMSDGQQCTALLSITMVERDVPLIIDQPEDMLDNKFIFSDVVEIIRSIKHDRQIISATHNANIPILGDAEQIIVMRSNSDQGFYGSCGSIDDPEIKRLSQDILEGGERAFRRRREKYRRTV